MTVLVQLEWTPTIISPFLICSISEGAKKAASEWVRRRDQTEQGQRSPDDLLTPQITESQTGLEARGSGFKPDQR